MRKQMTTPRPGPLATMTAAIVLGLVATTIGAPAFAQSSAEPVSPLPDCSGVTIGATLLSLHYPYLASLNDSMAAEAQRLGVGLVSLDPRHETDTELTQIRDLISQQVDAIIMIPVDGTVSQAAAKEVNAADIPLIEVNTKLGGSFFDDGGTIATYVGSNDRAGEIQAHHIAQRGNPVRVIYLVDEDGGASSDLRKDGFSKAMGEHRGLAIATELDGHGSFAEGKAIMEELLQVHGYGAFQGVVSQDDEMVLGALSAIEAAGRRDEFEILLGVGAGPDALQSIKDGGLTGSVSQDAVGQGIGAIQAACRIVAGQDLLPNTSIPFEMVTSESVDQFME